VFDKGGFAMRLTRKIITGAAIAAAGGAAAIAQPKPAVTGPVATYWVSAETVSGMAGMMGQMGRQGGGGGRPGMGSMMGMMMGGGMPDPNQAQHNLTLQLGSSRAPTGAASGEHAPPPDLGAGQTLPLLTPRVVRSEPEEPGLPPNFEQPRGRILIYWGCGERAGPGQPVTIDFSKLTPEAMRAGRVPPEFAALSRGMAVNQMRPPSPARSKTYGEWPNERTRTRVPPDSSLVGDHQVASTYAPEINFTLNQNQDFLAPLTITTNRTSPGGGNLIAWRSVPGAQSYLATVMGGGRNDTVVLWTSSQVQAATFAPPDYISPGEQARLVGQKVLLAPTTTSCVVPREVKEAAESGMLQLVAYGGEANFVDPPRPPKGVWNQQWAVKVRYRSATSAILGMDMSDMQGQSQDDEDEPRQRPRGGRRGMPFGLPGM
jgi:hypothetical protein